MAALIEKPNLQDHDAFYAALLAAHKGLSVEQSDALNAQLILILANHIGNRQVLAEAIELASRPR